MKFTDKLSALGFANYDAYLQSDHWRDFKDRYRKSGKLMRCLVCGGKRVQLHHHSYERLGEESLEDVDPLCRSHHIAVHEWLKASGKNIVERTPAAIKFLKNGSPKTVAKKQKVKKPKPPPRPEDAAEAQEIVNKIFAVESTKRQRKTAKKMADRNNLMQLRCLLKNVTVMIAAGINSPPLPKPQRPKKIKKEPLPPTTTKYRKGTGWKGIEHRPRQKPSSASTMSLIKQLIARGR